MRKVVWICAAIFILAVVAMSSRNSSTLFQQQLSEKHLLTVRKAPSEVPNSHTLQITYHNPPAIGTYMLAEQTVRSIVDPIAFTSATDSETTVVCVFDNHDIGFLLMYDPRTDDLWDSTGRAGGWNGSDEHEWQSLLTQLRSRNSNIPYQELPRGE